MAPHLTRPKRKHAENAIDTICEECYRYRKYIFKRDEFVKKDGYKHPDVLRAKPPRKMPIDDWNRHINFFLQPNQMKKSETNSKNRSKQPYPSVQGTRTNVASRYSRVARRNLGLGYESIHACINDCCLFWKENKFEENCPVCGKSRWKNKSTKGKNVPKKVLHYFPLTHRLRRMYNFIHIAKYMTWHATKKCKEDGKMCHPVDGKTWKDVDQKHKQFALEPRNVRLGLAVDGFNPFGNLSQDTPSTRVLGKIAYASHRRLLPKNHRWRKDKNFNDMDDTTDPPKTFNSANILDQLARFPQKIPGKHPDFGLISAKRKHDLTVELNWSKRSTFYELKDEINRPDRNGDTPISDVPVTKHELSVFEFVCSLIGKRTTITFNDKEYKKVECDFSTENPPTQLRSEFPRWFKTKITRLVAADKSRCSDDLLALAHRPEVFANSYTSCTVNGVRFTVHTRDQHRSTQNNGISTDGHDGTTYYGQLEEILEPIYTGGRNVVMFRCKCFNTGISGHNITHTRLSRAGQSTEVDNIQAIVSEDDDFIVDGVIDSDIDGIINVKEMALVLRHGGDASGNDQPPGLSRRPPHRGCQGSGGGKKGRSKTTLIAFRKMWEDNEKKLLPINFDSHDDGNPDEYLSLVSDFGLNHISKATGTYVNEAAATKHIPQRYVWLLLRWYPNTPSATKGKELQDALKSSQESGENVPEKEVVKKVLGTRSGHTCGVGQKLKGVSSSSSATSSSSRYYGGSKAYTQDEVNGLIEMEGKKLGKILGKKIGKRFASSFNKKLENLLTELAKKRYTFGILPRGGERG
ncbi:zinc finger, PHD-type containing protein [Tanacetum coccineum]